MSRVKDILLAVLYAFVVAVFFVLSVLVYNFLFECIFKHLILAKILRQD